MAWGCVEFAVPGNDLREKLKVLESRGMWLELANDGRKKTNEVQEMLASYSVPVRSVQAYMQHELQLLSTDKGERELARRHVEETIRMAAGLGGENVVVVIGYGEPGMENPRRACLDIFRGFGALAEELGVVASIEPLGGKTSLLPRVSDVQQLVEEVASENVRLLIDTMHVWSCEENPVQIIKKYSEHAKEIQLRDTDSKPPGAGEIDFTSIIKSIEGFPGLTCMEYRPGHDPWSDFELACKTCGVIRSE
jgi:sugar phosphate isomerase/epimerase